MPPKKVVEEEVLGPWSLGRFSSNLKVRATRENHAPNAQKASIAPAPPRDRSLVSLVVRGAVRARDGVSRE